jgi:NADPH-dependent 2,4-dienoyl-CoA reductase/sulfur reductase-like enzyme
VAERLVVIGGDAGGMSAASQARRLRDPDDLSIVAFERGNFTSYSACGVPYYVGTAVDDVDSLIARTPEVFHSDYAIDARIRTEVTGIDLDARAVDVRGPDGKASREGFDSLVVATGAVPVRPDLPGSSARNIFGVQTLDDGIAIERAIEELDATQAVVVGGGYIGLEMAEAFMARGMKVTVVEGAEHPMMSLDPDMGALVVDAMRQLDITVLIEEPAEAFEASEGRVRGVVTGSSVVPADIVVLGLGVRPNTDLADSAGIPVGPAGGVAVDPRLHTPCEGVWAAGDCVQKWHRVARRHVAIPLGTHANKEGRIAGINIGGGYATFAGVVGTAVSRVCDVEVGRTGLKESEVVELGLEGLGVVVDATTRAGYFPEAAPIRTKLVVERRTGRLLGAQIVGKEGAAKRIDVLATALWNEMSVDDIVGMDLSYAPPFSPVWDPVLIAARQAWHRVEETMPGCR